MASGYALKEGKYNQDYHSAKDIKNALSLFFEKTAAKESTYKYAMFKSIIDCVDVATDKTFKISFDVLFARFSELYWVLVFKYNLPQRNLSKNTSKTLAEKIIDDIVIKYKIRKNTRYQNLPTNIQKEMILQMKKKCSRYVFGALYAETDGMLYSFSKEKEWVKLNPYFVNYLKKHEKTIQSQNYLAWGKFYATIVLAGDIEAEYYQRLLKREFSGNYIGKNISVVNKRKKKAEKPIKSIKPKPTIIKTYNREIAVKARKVVSQYPDLGLYFAQIYEKVGGDKEDLQVVLDHSFWCRREGKRYFYNNVTDGEVIAESLFQKRNNMIVETQDNSQSDVDIDAENIKLLNDPEKLIKKLKKEKGLISSSALTDRQSFKITQDECNNAKSTSFQRKWDREEVVILVTEYFRTKNNSTDEILKNQQEISDFLRRREETITGMPVDDTFRNFAGIRMQSSRIRCIDPETKYSGMQGTKLQKEIVQEYLNDPKKLIAEAESIKMKYHSDCL